MGNRTRNMPPDQTPNLSNEQRINVMLQHNSDNDSIFYTLSRLAHNLHVHQDDATRAKLAEKFGIPCPPFDKLARQRLLEQIRKCKCAYMKENALLNESLAYSMDDDDDGSARSLADIDIVQINRFSTGIETLDAMLGRSDDGEAGLPEGVCLLFGAAKGIGKTRLTVQVAAHVGNPNAQPDAYGNHGVLYIQNEESLDVFRSRAAQKVWTDTHKILLSSSNNLEQHVALIDRHRPKLIIIDSLQDTMQSRFHGGLMNMMCTYKGIAKTNRCTFWLISHVTTKGEIKGGTYPGHKVDIEMTAERMPFNQGEFIIHCDKKNRYGATGKKAVFAHTPAGVVAVKENLSRNFVMNSSTLVIPAANKVENIALTRIPRQEVGT